MEYVAIGWLVLTIFFSLFPWPDYKTPKNWQKLMGKK